MINESKPSKLRKELQEGKLDLKEMYTRTVSEIKRFRGDKDSELFKSLEDKRLILLSDIDTLTSRIKDLTVLDSDPNICSLMDNEYDMIEDMLSKMDSIEDNNDCSSMSDAQTADFFMQKLADMYKEETKESVEKLISTLDK